MIKPRLAAIAACWNDPVFVPQFLRHYSPEVDQIFLIDNESTEDTTSPAKDYPNVTLLSYHTGDKFDGWKKQEELLKVKESCIRNFDYVFLLDIDEFLVPQSNIVPLGEKRSFRDVFKDLSPEPVFGTQGWNMYEFPWDKPYDPATPLIQQRKHGFENAHYSKPIIVRPEYPVKYPIGFHYVLGDTQPLLRPFCLLHYRAFSDEVFVERSLKFSTRLSEREFRSGGGVYYWQVTKESLKSRLEYEKKAGTPTQVLP